MHNAISRVGHRACKCPLRLTARSSRRSHLEHADKRRRIRAQVMPGEVLIAVGLIQAGVRIALNSSGRLVLEVYLTSICSSS